MKTGILSLVLLCILGACSKVKSSEMPQQTSRADTLRYLALGDSYTKGESVPVALNFPNQLSDSLEQGGNRTVETTIIAETGWTTTNLKQAIAKAKPDSNYNLVSLLIGVNNFYQNKDTNLYLIEFEELLQSALVFAGGKPDCVIVVSIPDYAYSPIGQSGNPSIISQQTDHYNQMAARISAKYGVSFIDITAISQSYDPSLIASDGLHPSSYQYGLWVAKILDALDF